MPIEVKNVSKTFREIRAVDNVSVTFETGHIYGLLGDNGAGKSTLLHIITDRICPDHGEVLLDGAPVHGKDAALGRLFLVGEQNLFPEDMRVRKAFRVLPWFYPAFDPARAAALAEQFGLNVKQKIRALSTGYASIFRLVLALTAGTPYLFLDEPVLGLDARHRDLFYRLLLERFTETGCAVVLSTHLIAEAANLIDHAVIIRQGRILQDTSSEELLAAAYAVSGPAAAVDAYAAGKRVLSEAVLGGLKTVCIQEKPEGELPKGLERAPMNLQDYFIRLMEEEEKRA